MFHTSFFYDETKRGAVLRTYYYIWTLVRKIVRQFATMENISISKMLDRLDVGRKVQGEYEIPTDYNQYLISESLEQIYKIIDENPQMFLRYYESGGYQKPFKYESFFQFGGC